ncbi:MAG TPA: hypothetical protein VKR56_08460 [Candidatus Cybelea sp.]|nr:hypothetical protein [Candidatus Cybelea sp.]
MGTTASNLHVLLPPEVSDGLSEISRAYEGLGYAPASAADWEKRVILRTGDSQRYISVYDSDNDKLDSGELKELAARLSERLHTVALQTAVYDSDAYLFLLYHDGKQIDAAAEGEPWCLDVLEVLPAARRTKRWRDLFGGAAPKAAGGASIFAEDALARWCTSAGLPSQRTTALVEDFSEPDDAVKTTLYFKRDATRATSVNAAPRAQEIKFFRSDDDQPYLAVYPAAWPALAMERQLASWGAATSGPGFRGLRVTFAVEATGTIELLAVTAVAWPFFSGQVTSLKAPAKAQWSDLNEPLGTGTIVKDAADFELPPVQSGSRKQLLILAQVALRLSAGSSITLRPVLESLDGALAPLALPPARFSGTEPFWRPNAGSAPEVVAALNEPAVATRWATLTNGLQPAHSSAQRWFDAWLRSLSAPPGTMVKIFAESQLTQQLRTSKSNWSAPLAKLTQQKRWPSFFEAQRDYRVVTFELTLPGELFPMAGGVLCSAHRNPRKGTDGEQGDEPLNCAVWFINDPTIYARLETSPEQQEQIFERWLETTDALQAWSTAATWFPANVDEVGLTLYERAVGDIEHPYRGAQLRQLVRAPAWPRRRLRFVARKLWLGAALHAQVDSKRLEAIATLRPCGTLVGIAIADQVALDTLERVLAPLLPSLGDVIAGQESEARRQTDRFQRAYGLEQTAIAEMQLSERDGEVSRLERAIELLELARTLYSSVDSPQGWASMERNRGMALTRLGERTSDIGKLEAAVRAQREAVAALDGGHDEVTPGHRQAWVLSRIQLAAALSSLGSRSGKLADLEEAESILAGCTLENVTEQEAALFDAALEVRRGVVALHLAKRRYDRSGVDAALAQMENAIQLLRERSPRAHAVRYERLLEEARDLASSS